MELPPASLKYRLSKQLYNTKRPEMVSKYKYIGAESGREFTSKTSRAH